MKLFMMNLLRERNLTIGEFFRLAHVWKFGKDRDMSDSVAQYVMHGVIPKFVCEYLKTFQ
jgi:uncharacterized protein YhfF